MSLNMGGRPPPASHEGSAPGATWVRPARLVRPSIGAGCRGGRPEGPGPTPITSCSAEIMLQQTTAATVSRRFRVSSRAFPASPRWQPPTWPRSCTPGRVSATTAGPAPCMRWHSRGRRATAAGCRPSGGAAGAARHRPLHRGCAPRDRLREAAVPVDGNVLRVWRGCTGSRAAAVGAARAGHARPALARSSRPGDLAQALMDLGAPSAGRGRRVAPPAPGARPAPVMLPALPSSCQRPRARHAPGAARRRLPADPARRRDPVPAPARGGPAGRPPRAAVQPLAGGGLALAAALDHAPAAADWRLHPRRSATPSPTSCSS